MADNAEHSHPADAQPQQIDGLQSQLAAADIDVSAEDGQRKELLAAQAPAAAEAQHRDVELEAAAAHVEALLRDIKAERACGRDAKPLLLKIRPEVIAGLHAAAYLLLHEQTQLVRLVHELL